MNHPTNHHIVMTKLALSNIGPIMNEAESTLPYFLQEYILLDAHSMVKKGVQ